MNDMLKHLNTDGNELIYEEPGDAERGNPLDIVTIATLYTARTVTGRKFTKQDRAEALALFAGAAGLLAACKLWDEGFVDGEQFTPEQFLQWVNNNRRAAREAIAKATPESGTPVYDGPLAVESDE